MNEAETRAEHIDPALIRAGWGVVEGRRGIVFLKGLFCTHSPSGARKVRQIAALKSMLF